jgi:hypothetical protein
MSVNFNLMKLKLDMVYRDLDMEEAGKRFSEMTTTMPVPKTKPVIVRKSVKPLKPKSS